VAAQVRQALHPPGDLHKKLTLRLLTVNSLVADSSHHSIACDDEGPDQMQALIECCGNRDRN